MIQINCLFIKPNPSVCHQRPDTQYPQYRLELHAARLVAPRLVDYLQYVKEQVDDVEVELQSAHNVVIRVELHPVACKTKIVRGCRLSTSCPQRTNAIAAEASLSTILT